MTDRGRYRRFKTVFALWLLPAIAACATSSAAPPVASPGLSDAPRASPTVGPRFRAELSSPQSVDGGIVLVDVTLPADERGKAVEAKYEDIALPFYPVSEGVYEAVLGVPFNHKPGPTEVKITVGSDESLSLPLAVVAGDYRSEELKVDPRRVNPSNPKDLVRIKKDSAEIGQVYARVTQKKYWKGPFRFPIKSVVTSPFGTKRVFNGEMKSFHTGLDLRAKVGTPIRAAAGGVVVLAHSLFFTGNTVLIDHGYGVLTLYAHMSRIRVKKGQLVKPGQFLGLSGKTGRVSGPHLHWQAIIHKTKVNPLILTQVMR
jgi:murein DD-endopeptidase MepM/ murein hydrolase activator NlpD